MIRIADVTERSIAIRPAKILRRASTVKLALAREHEEEVRQRAKEAGGGNDTDTDTSGAPTPPLLESFALGTPPPNAESDGSEAPRGARGARRARARGDHAATTRPSKSRRRS